jgi:hypothetical protein
VIWRRRGFQGWRTRRPVRLPAWPKAGGGAAVTAGRPSPRRRRCSRARGGSPAAPTNMRNATGRPQRVRRDAAPDALWSFGNSQCLWTGKRLRRQPPAIAHAVGTVVQLCLTGSYSNLGMYVMECRYLVRRPE